MHGISLDSWLNDTSERRQASPALANVGVPLMIGGAIVAFAPLLWTAPARFWTAYLIAVCYFASIALGAQFLVAAMYLTGARWGIVVRRLAEVMAMGIGIVGVAFIPILVIVFAQQGVLFLWTDPAFVEGNSLLEHKQPYLNPTFFAIRQVIYFISWYWIARFFYRGSITQDRAQTNAPMAPLRTWCGPALMWFAFTISMASFDWMMSLAPTWFSTMFGVYYFAGSAVAIFSSLILVSYYLQQRGVLAHTITVEHYHDLAKLLFGFVVFWGYIAFSQFMLIWYANIPEETQWFAARQGEPTSLGISVPTAALFIGHLFIPFLGFMSSAVRRNKPLMAAWAVYMLIWHWYDLFYIISPSQIENAWAFGVPEIMCTVGIGALFVGSVMRYAAGQWLVPVRDPRLGKSLAFVNH